MSKGAAILITGAGGAIGAEISRAFATNGDLIVAVDKDAAALDRLRPTLSGGPHFFRPADLTSCNMDDLVSDCVRETGGVRALVHVAAVLQRRNTIFEVTDDDLQLQINLNFVGTFRINRAIARHFIDSGRPGSIVNFASQGWWTGGFGGSVIYNATKGAVVTMTRGLARTLAPHRIRVNAIAPGMIDTPMLRNGLTDDALASVVAATPMARLGSPNEMSGAAIFLCSEQATFITGAVINISGGFLMY